MMRPLIANMLIIKASMCVIIYLPITKLQYSECTENAHATYRS